MSTGLKQKVGRMSNNALDALYDARLSLKLTKEEIAAIGQELKERRKVVESDRARQEKEALKLLRKKPAQQAVCYEDTDDEEGSLTFMRLTEVSETTVRDTSFTVSKTGRLLCYREDETDDIDCPTAEEHIREQASLAADYRGFKKLTNKQFESKLKEVIGKLVEQMTT